MGILAPVSAQAWPSAQPPIDTSEKIVGHVSERGGNKIDVGVIMGEWANYGHVDKGWTLLTVTCHWRNKFLKFYSFFL